MLKLTIKETFNVIREKKTNKKQKSNLFFPHVLYPIACLVVCLHIKAPFQSKPLLLWNVNVVVENDNTRRVLN